MELVCDLCKIKKVEQVLPLHRIGEALAVYPQLSKEQKVDVQIKRALLIAFMTDLFMVFNQYTMRCLHPEEVVDVFLTDLEKIPLLIGKLPKQSCPDYLATSDKHIGHHPG